MCDQDTLVLHMVLHIQMLQCLTKMNGVCKINHLLPINYYAHILFINTLFIKSLNCTFYLQQFFFFFPCIDSATARDTQKRVLQYEKLDKYMSRHMRKPTICICENKGAEADQRLCFRYTDSKIPLLSKSKISSF